MTHDKNFKELAQCLNGVKEWKLKNSEPVPERLLEQLENALEKSLENYCKNKHPQNERKVLP